MQFVDTYVDPETAANLSGEDAEMRAAISDARGSLATFLAAFYRPTPQQKGFLLKVRFTEQNDSEHIWVSNLNMSSDPLSGTLANDPRLRGREIGERCTFTADQIIDWMYCDGTMIAGGFTTRLLLRREYEAKIVKSFLPVPPVN